MADTATQNVPSTPKKNTDVESTKDSAQNTANSKVSDAKTQAPDADPTENGTQNNEFDEQTDSGVDGLASSNGEAEKEEGDDEAKEEADDEASEVLPAGSVNSKGEIISEAGEVIGRISGENASQLEGSMVDREGDVLDEEGNILGHADLDAESLQQLDPKPTSEAGDALKSQDGETEKPDASTGEPDAEEGTEKADTDNVEGGDLAEEAKQDLEGTEKPDVEGADKPDVDDVKDGESVNPDVEGVEKPDIEGSDKPGVEGADKPDVDGVEKPDVEGAEKPDVEGAEKPDVEGVDASEKPDGADVDAPGAEDVKKPELSGPFGVQDNGDITDATGVVIGKLADGTPQDLVGTSIKDIDGEGNLLAENGSILGKADLKSELLDKKDEAEAAKPELVGPFDVEESGEIKNAEGQVVANLPEGQDLEGKSIKDIDSEGNLKDEKGSIIAKAELLPELLEKSESQAEGADAPEGAEAEGAEGAEADGETPEGEAPDLSILKGMKVNKVGRIVDEDGNPHGVLVEGDAKKLAGRKVDGEGKIWDDSGKVIGRAELLPEDERQAEKSGPFEDFPDSVLDGKGNVMFENKIVGKLVEGDAKALEGKKVDADGDVLDKNGNTLGRAERYQEEEEAPPEEEQPEDLSALDGKKVNKAGNVVDDNGKLFGRVNSGVLSKLVGKKCDAEGKIWSESGKVIGTAELIPMDDRDEVSESPFEDFPGATVDSKGNVIFEEKIVGRLIEGDAKKLSGKKVDQDGEIVDRVGNVLGKAERWEPEEPEEEEPVKVDNSALAGKRVNKSGNVVDSNGQIYGRLVEGDANKLAGKMCDKDGNVWNEGGTIVGRAELVPESEREGEKEGPFSGFDSPTVTKDGKVADSKGTVIGRLIEGEAAKLYGKLVDADGDVLDKNGNTLGRAERWEEEVKEKKKNPVAGRKINRDGNVLDDDGDVIGRLTDGEIGKCVGKEIDDDGDITNSKGQTLGHVSLLEDIPEPEAEPEPEVEEEAEPEPEPEDPEEVERKKQLEQDRKLANQMAGCVQGSLDKIKPILKMISENIEAEERKPEGERDEQKLVDNVKPLIEEGGQILQEANGVIRGLDPDGRIAANAKAKTASREATPEEYHLADVLKDLTENVTTTIDKAKKKINGMPHAKKQLNPLWGLLAEPLGQILAAVGLLLSGVLGLVGKLLSGLGLGGLLDGLLGGLGLKGILNGLGLGSVTGALTGKK
ncbi:hypothetical protein GLAREA_03759 [Glarea lozoyensis ATCC 20868]|uniref:DUF6987 domain-containing protein n=1 Tax=Glarea lozoyensis (strain ATCC 20868 / MF5171) TaxID=1116229 RepID=S3CWS8_GLAL2|nr:uncharacterized protein GLAREA_03759 [Glarea lozoyensis ATCC 20868]EPE30792.1 hypothetical protein GLAREA_03759 [Glarea lozoyensis ATCC 20868]